MRNQISQQILPLALLAQLVKKRYVSDNAIGISDMLPPLIEVGASRSRILPNPVSTS